MRRRERERQRIRSWQIDPPRCEGVPDRGRGRARRWQESAPSARRAQPRPTATRALRQVPHSICSCIWWAMCPAQALLLLCSLVRVRVFLESWHPARELNCRNRFPLVILGKFLQFCYALQIVEHTHQIQQIYGCVSFAICPACALVLITNSTGLAVLYRHCPCSLSQGWQGPFDPCKNYGLTALQSYDHRLLGRILLPSTRIKASACVRPVPGALPVVSARRAGCRRRSPYRPSTGLDPELGPFGRFLSGLSMAAGHDDLRNAPGFVRSTEKRFHLVQHDL